MARLIGVVLLMTTILLNQDPAHADASASPLEQRLEGWPAWTLPGPLQRPGPADDLVYPAWFEGLWQVESEDLDAPEENTLRHLARFQRDTRGRVVGDRSFNANSIGRAVFGDQLLRVEDDPESANRQMAQLRGDLRLETSVTGRLQEQPEADSFLTDELVLQILHAPGPPRLSRIETFSRYIRLGDGISAEQWQARFNPPGESLRDAAVATHRYRLRLTPLQEIAP